MANAVVAAKLVEDRYIVLFPCHVIKSKTETKGTRSKNNTRQNTNTPENNPHKKQKTTQKKSSDVTGTTWVKQIC